MRKAAWLILGLVACDAPAPESAPSPTPSSAPPPEVVDVRPGPATLTELPAGPEGQVARRQAVLELLADGKSAAALPLVDTAPDRGFDPELADKLTPRVPVEGNWIPTVRQAKATVVGPLDKDPIRRIVRAHINEIRLCYYHGLAMDTTLRGRVVVEFKILGDGKVGESVVRETTLDDADVSACIGAAPLRWEFPRPERGETVTVTYPFVLEPG